MAFTQHREQMELIQHRALVAFRQAQEMGDRETLIGLLGESAELPTTLATLALVVTPDFPDGSAESRACWRLLRDSMGADDGRIEFLIEHLTSPKGRRLLARVLVNSCFEGRAAELLAQRADVLALMPPISISLDSDAALDTVAAFGLSSRLSPYGVALPRLLRYFALFGEAIRHDATAFFMHARAFGDPGNLELINQLESLV